MGVCWAVVSPQAQPMLSYQRRMFSWGSKSRPWTPLSVAHIQVESLLLMVLSLIKQEVFEGAQGGINAVGIDLVTFSAVAAAFTEVAGGAELFEMARSGGLAEVESGHNLLGVMFAVFGEEAEDTETGVIGEGVEADEEFVAVEVRVMVEATGGEAGAKDDAELVIVFEVAEVGADVGGGDEEEGVGLGE